MTTNDQLSRINDVKLLVKMKVRQITFKNNKLRKIKIIRQIYQGSSN